MTTNIQGQLESAILGADAKAVEQAVSVGADVNYVPSERFESTPLELALSNKKEAIARLLIDLGADPNLIGSKGDSPLVCAESKSDFAMLIDAGADINIANKGGKTVLMRAADSHNYDRDSRYSTSLVRYLVEQGADIDLQDESGRTVLHAAAFRGRHDLVELFLELGCDYTVVNKNGETAADWTHADQSLIRAVRKFRKACDKTLALFSNLDGLTMRDSSAIRKQHEATLRELYGIRVPWWKFWKR